MSPMKEYRLRKTVTGIQWKGDVQPIKDFLGHDKVTRFANTLIIKLDGGEIKAAMDDWIINWGLNSYNIYTNSEFHLNFEAI